ncbi:hypothetical protein [Rhizobium sp. BR 315]|uniref:hypothetical protein n=1 Tax=Rhizobium sp. BR 315 TaxID=3040014 RepID=UPI003D32ED51
MCKFELVGSLVQPKSPIHMTHIWIAETEQPIHWVSEHIHDYDEILIWTGSDLDNPRDLGAEIYIDIEGECRTITSFGSIFIPRWRQALPAWHQPCLAAYHVPCFVAGVDLQAKVQLTSVMGFPSAVGPPTGLSPGVLSESKIAGGPGWAVEGRLFRY